MKNLLNLALKTTRENVVKNSKVENVNDSIIEVLYKQKLKLDRVDLVAHIAHRRLELKYGAKALEAMTEAEYLKLIKPVIKTVKNGVDTSISHSQNNSSFHYNDKYSDYKLELVNGLYQVTKIS